jgi:hypothetical protein
VIAIVLSNDLRQRLGVHPGGNHQAREGVAGLVQPDRLEPRLTPAAERPPAHRGRLEGSLGRDAEHQCFAAPPGRKPVGEEDRR